jgi:hypothetical protein
MLGHARLTTGPTCLNYHVYTDIASHRRQRQHRYQEFARYLK